MSGQASIEVLDLAGGAWNAALNHYGVGGNCMVTTVQVDRTVYVVGQDDFSIGIYTLDQWAGRSDAEPAFIESSTAQEAWDTLRSLRAGCYRWQCGSCDDWIFTSDRPPSGALECSTCDNGGVDFAHAWRHTGGAG